MFYESPWYRTEAVLTQLLGYEARPVPKSAQPPEHPRHSGGKKQTRHHRFTERRAWRPQITRLWRDIGKACEWNHPRAPLVKWLWKEKATEAVLRFLRDTKVGYVSTRGKPPKECDGDGAEGEGAGLPTSAISLVSFFGGGEDGRTGSFVSFVISFAGRIRGSLWFERLVRNVSKFVS